MVTNTDIAVMQRGTPWPSEAAYAAPVTPTSTAYDIRQGQDVAIALEVATPMTADIQTFLKPGEYPSVGLSFSDRPAARATTPPPGQESPPLAVGLRDAARRAARGHPRVRLFLAAPMGLAVLLSHRWNRTASHHRLRGLSCPGLPSRLYR